ncbi:hypothetical protein KR50_02910 [Jeotgalibacillus campisalis]|uniref:Uncharacterized protein n=1 Tax=Jeotgalibacillus campisalis TaxID=220754 RepID=A0A0C2VVN6_9BACL|nr:hypothetical protein KR50_02910 [Jeotgalibacillus campisalis]
MRHCRCDSIKVAHLPPRGKPPPAAEINRSPCAAALPTSF